MNSLFSQLLSDFAYLIAALSCIGVLGVLVGLRIGTQRLAVPILAQQNALASLDEENLHRLKARYLEQQFAWERAMVLAGLLALLAGAIYLAYQTYSTEPHAGISFLLGNMFVLFLSGVATTGYQCGARVGMVKAFARASTSQLVALHKRMSKPSTPLHVNDLMAQLPKKKCFIHLMVVHYAIHTAEKNGAKVHNV